MLRELRLHDFRCFEQLVLEPAPGLNFIIGPNAQGKTSILEAACILLRTAIATSGLAGEAVRFDQAGFGLGRPLERAAYAREIHQRAQGLRPGFQAAVPLERLPGRWRG